MDTTPAPAPAQEPNESVFSVRPGLESEWMGVLEKNQDEFGRRVVAYATSIGKYLDEGQHPYDAAVSANEDHQVNGMLQQMAGLGCAVICHFHPRGDDYREFWTTIFGKRNEAPVPDTNIIITPPPSSIILP